MQEGSILRFAVLTLLFFTVLGGSVFLMLFADRPYGIQLTSIVIYNRCRRTLHFQPQPQ